MSLRELRDRLKEIEEAKRSVIANGHLYSIQGSHSSQRENLDALAREERRIRKRILRTRGITATTTYTRHHGTDY